jgi:hypothetical protein
LLCTARWVGGLTSPEVDEADEVEFLSEPEEDDSRSLKIELAPPGGRMILKRAVNRL